MLLLVSSSVLTIILINYRLKHCRGEGSPLHSAVETCEWEMAEYLVNAGVDVNMVDRFVERAHNFSEGF